MGFGEARRALRGWGRFQRARLAQSRHPELGEISEYCFYASRLRFGDLAFDIGANEGVHTVQMVKRGARVVAVEPQTELAAKLARRFPSVTVVQVAVSDEPGTAGLHLAAEGNDIASLNGEWVPLGNPPHWYDVQQVEVVTLRDLIERYGHPGLIKTDTEGFDHRVLRTLERPVEHIFFEVHGAHQPDAEQALGHLDGLGKYEYRVSRFHSWLLSPEKNASQTLDEIETWDDATWGNVYARLLED
jgi:FkbM family methyltransferase